MKVTQRLSFCALLSALSVVCLLLTAFPYASYALAALAGMMMIPAALELGTKYALACYAVVAVLGFLLTPDAEAKVLFAFFFGYYPIVQMRVDLWCRKWLQLLVKFAIFNVAAIGAYVLSVFVMGIDPEAFTVAGVFIPPLLLVFGNVVFIVYDIALRRVEAFYRMRLHPHVKRLFRR